MIVEGKLVIGSVLTTTGIDGMLSTMHERVDVECNCINPLIAAVMSSLSGGWVVPVITPEVLAMASGGGGGGDAFAVSVVSKISDFGMMDVED